MERSKNKANKYVNKVVVGAEVKLHLSQDTISPDKLAKDITAHDKSGAPIVGTSTLDVDSSDATAAVSVPARKTTAAANSTFRAPYLCLSSAALAPATIEARAASAEEKAGEVQARAQAAQEAQQAAQIGQMVPAMKDAAAAAELLSRADVGGESLLKRLIQP